MSSRCGIIGSAPGPAVNGRSTVFVVELFTRRPGKVEPAKVGEQLVARIAEKRAAAKATALAADPTLEKAAQAYAAALAASGGALSDAEGNKLLPSHKGRGPYIRIVAFFVHLAVDRLGGFATPAFALHRRGHQIEEFRRSGDLGST
jgi:hypothetical protein